jgi:hypothetical protein
MSRQTDLEERQATWREEQQAPRLNVEEWEFISEEELEDDPEDDEEQTLKRLLDAIGPQGDLLYRTVCTLTVANTGETPARNLRLRIQPLISGTELPPDYHDISLLIPHFRESLVRLDTDDMQQYLNRENPTLRANETAEFVTWVHQGVVPTFEDNASFETIGDVLRAFPVEIERVAFRAVLVSEDIGGDEFETPIAAVMLPPDNLTTLAQAFSLGRRVGLDTSRIADFEATKEYFDSRYGGFSEDDGLVSVEYDFRADEKTNDGG